MISPYHPRTELLIIEFFFNGAKTYTYATNEKDWISEARKKEQATAGTIAKLYHWRKCGYSDDNPRGWFLWDYQEVALARV